MNVIKKFQNTITKSLNILSKNSKKKFSNKILIKIVI